MKFSFEGTMDEFNELFRSGGMNQRKVIRVAEVGPAQVINVPASSTATGVGAEAKFEKPEEDVSRPATGHALAPDYSQPASATNFWRDQLPVPVDSQPYQAASTPAVALPTIEPHVRAEAWRAFVEFTVEWVQGFGDPTVAQPNRLELMEELGHGRLTIPILIMAYEIKSLQRMIEYALNHADEPRAANLDFVDQVACNMVQVCHMGFPDLAGTYDYSTSWRRNPPTWSKP